MLLIVAENIEGWNSYAREAIFQFEILSANQKQINKL